MKKNEKIGDNHLIINNKYYEDPPKKDQTIKDLFRYAAVKGLGRDLKKEEFVNKPWTPESLTDEISKRNVDKSSIDLRTVQLWFQLNEKGIGITNILLLAKIFGCDDPDKVRIWQAALITAQDKLKKKRKENRDLVKLKSNPENKTNDQIEVNNPIEQRQFKTLAEKIENLLILPNSTNLIIVSLLIFCGLGLINFVLGTLNVTYSINGLEKQVGFIWSPSLTVLPLIVIPLYIYFVSDLVSYWKRFGRLICVSNDVKIVNHDHQAWCAKLNNFSLSFWAITLFCLLFVFGVQWAGIYLPSYFSGDANGVQIDRYLISLVEPNVLTIAESMFLSIIGYLYTASYIAILMFGLLFILIISFDYFDLFTVSDLENSSQIYEVGQKIIWGNFRIVVLGIWFSILIKLQVTYLASDSPNVINWLITDFISIFIDSAQNGWLNNTTISHFTTFLMMLVTVFTFVFSVVKIRSVFERMPIHNRNDKHIMVQMFIVVGILGLNLIVIGYLPGFTYLLITSVIASFYVLSGLRLQKF